jgi:16S rRNA (adenine1518-N6/adenine1519-N6)-dimethyltransferase
VPRKRFGQHFLAPAWAQKVLRAIEPAPGDVFLEIGPGTGAITLPLAATGMPVLAVEIDRDLAADLATRVPANVTLLTGDFLKLDVTPFLTGLEPQRPAHASPATFPARRFRAVGNLPYNLSSPILFRLIELYRHHRLLTDATVMLQREVADRLVAKPGSKDYGVLTVSVQMAAKATRLLNLPPGAFSPAPKVQSALVRLTFGAPVLRVPDEDLLERVIRAVFAHRRKTLLNTLKRFDPSASIVLAMAGIDGGRRPETLQLTEIARLAELFASARRVPVL